MSSASYKTFAILINQLILVIGILSEVEGSSDSCGCLPCKTIPDGEYGGNYSLHSTEDPSCPSSCLYYNDDPNATYTKLCFCDPGPVDYSSFCLKNDGVKCGVQRIDPNCLASSNRIVNGEKTNCNEYPWMVGLMFKLDDGNFYRYIECGGALLNNNTVLTAASCIFTRGSRHRELLVSLAEWAPYVKPDHFPPAYKNVLVTDIHIHPDYNQTNIDIFNPRDVAVLKLSVEVDLSIYTPVCMPPTTLKSATDLAGKKTATIMGWGDLYLYLPSPQGGTIAWNPPQQLNPTVLMKVSDLPIVTNQICNASVSYSEKIQEGMFCAGEDDQDGGPWPTPAGTGQGPCLKDSGGPLTVEVASGVHEVVGLASWGIGCGQSYNVYTDVPYLEIEDWILEKAGEVYRYTDTSNN